MLCAIFAFFAVKSFCDDKNASPQLAIDHSFYRTK